MNKSVPITPYAPMPVLPLPGWIGSARGDTLEAASFGAGAALAHLHFLMGQDTVPQALWRDRLALAAAEVCARHTGRRESAAGLRDAVHLTRPGDDPGPAGAIFRQWSRAVAQPLSLAGLSKALEGVPTPRIAQGLDVAGGTPMDRAAAAVEAMLMDNPRAEMVALILGDAVLAKSLGWKHVLPLTSLTLKPRDLRLRGEEFRLACHRAVVAGAGQAVPLAADLVQAEARLRAVAPKLRAKAATRAVEMLLSRDALPPSALTTFMTDRAARRLCDRLVTLGAVRELTGRETFRLYGV